MTALAPKLPDTPIARHIAIIMDGNGRWATRRNRPRVFGHRAGVEALRRAVEAAGDLGLGYLTVFGFSTENWRRPRDEVEALLGLMKEYVQRDLDRLVDEGVRVRVIGDRSDLRPDILTLILRAETATAHNSRLNLTLAFNYGGQSELVRAAKRACEAVAAGRLEPHALTAERFTDFLDTRELPDPDVIIRTSGEQRISNFLLWQAAYAELVFLDVLWPDFEREHLEAAMGEFAKRARRFGGLG